MSTRAWLKLAAFCLFGLALGATACGDPAATSVDEEVATSKQDLSLTPYFYLDDNGRVARYVPLSWIESGRTLSWDSLTIDKIALITVDSNWAYQNTQNNKRNAIVQTAVAEANRGLCGAPAHTRYGLVEGQNWCTEYARSVLGWSGFRNIRYCYVHFLTCLDYFYFTEARTVDEMVTVFAENNGWTNRTNTRTTTPRPGDYVALTGSSGKPKTHSAIVIAVSNDFRYIWTSDGNLADCAGSARRDFFVNGVLDSKINGFGNVSVGL